MKLSVLLVRSGSIVHDLMVDCYYKAFKNISADVIRTSYLEDKNLKSGKFQWRKLTSVFNFKYINSIFYDFKFNSPDFVFVFNLELRFFIIFLIRLFFCKTRVVYICHEPRLEMKGLKYKIINFFNFYFQRFSDIVIYPSDGAKSLGDELGFINKSFKVELTFEDNFRGEQGVSTKEILFFGAMDDNKCPWLINDFVKVSEESNFTFKRVGIDITTKKINYSEKIDVNNVFVDNDFKKKLFSTTGYLVLPYLEIRQSGVLADALSYGIPVIVSDIPEFRQYIVDGENGFILKDLSLNGIRSVLNKCEELSESDYYKLSKGAYSTYKEYFSISTLSRNLSRIISYES